MTELAIAVGLLLGAAALIYVACEYFVNGVEWLGGHFRFSQKATGTILAAFGTALPESVVTLVAVAFGAAPQQKAIGVGAALGGPLVLATVAYAVVGWTLLATRRPLKSAGPDGRPLGFDHLSRDQGWFLCIFVAKLGLGLVAFASKPWLGLAFLAAYGAYVWQETRHGPGDGAHDEGEPEPLKITPHVARPTVWMALLQTAGAVVVIFLASRQFVHQIGVLGPKLGFPPQLLALLVSPIATEMPETLNAILWIRQGKVRLALANISGAMMIQATIPTAFGLFFTSWLFDRALVLAGAVTLLATLSLYLGFRSGRISRTWLSATVLFYVAFIAALVVWRV